MAKKLSDAEFIERTRLNNRRRSERQRERQATLGKSALTVWISVATKAALTASAKQAGVTVADMAEQWLSSNANQEPGDFPKHKEKPDPDLFSEPEPVPVDNAPAPLLTKDERDRQILELKQQGLSNPEIGRRFNTSEGSIRRALKRIQQAVH